MNNKSYDKTILRIGPYPTHEESGRGFHLYELSKIKNIKVIYLTFFKKDSSHFDIPENVILCTGSFYANPIPRDKGKLIRFFYELYRLFKIIIFSFHGSFLILKYRVDIVHIHSPMFVLVGVIGFLLRKRIYITFHGTDFHRIKNAKWYTLFSNMFDKVFIISPDMKEVLSKIHKSKKIVLVNNGIDLDVFQNFNKKRKKQIIAVGSLKHEKGYKYLIEAFSEMLNTNINLIDYKLIIIGEGLLRNDLEKQIISVNMQNNISLIGQKDRSEVIELYNESELFVLSSISEGFPKVILEAMACGCKIVATNVGSISKILDKTDFEIIEPKDTTQLKEAIFKTIQNNYIYYQNVLEKYTWDSAKKVYIAEFK